MRVCLFEDQGVPLLEPLTLTRPAFDLWCGTSSLLDRHRRHFAAAEMGALVRPSLAALCREAHPDLSVNDPAWLRVGPAVMVNARWLPSDEDLDLTKPQVALAGGQVAYVVTPLDTQAACTPEAIDAFLERWKADRPQRPAGGWMINYPWDLVARNAEVLSQDALLHKREERPLRPPGLTLVGPPDRLIVHPCAGVEPLVLADTTHGPVVIDRVATVKAFSRLEGPCYIGPGSWVLGAKVSSSTIGPVCRVGGEVEASIVQGFSNKAHDGYLGHSYLGEWINLGAGTQVSNLRTDYEPIRMLVAGREIDTGVTKVGSFFGDHTRTGISTLLNVGTAVGAFCQLYHSNLLPPRRVPSFCRFARGCLEQGPELDRLLAAAETAMSRRGVELTGVQADYYRWLHGQTAAAQMDALARVRK